MARGPKKPDKWRDMLKAAERQHYHMTTLVEILQEEQHHLRLKEDVLEQIAEAMGVVCTCIAHSSTTCPGTSADWPPSSWPQAASGSQGCQPQGSLPSIGITSSAPAPATMLQDPSCANGSSPCSNPGFVSPSPSGVLEGLEAQVQQQLLLALADSGRSQPFPATTFMQVLLHPANQAVCDTSKVSLRLKHLAGRCALLLLKESDISPVWDMQQALDHLNSIPCAAAAAISSRGSSNYSHGSMILPEVHPAAAFNSAGPAHDIGPASAAEQSHNEAADAALQATLLSSSAPGIIHPALEFMLLVLRSMMNDSTNEFFVLTNMNLETQESPYTASEEHWRTAARKLQLSADQIAVLTCMRKVISSAMTPLFSNLTLVAQQQGAGVHKHSSQLSSLQAPQHPHPSAHVALKQAQAEHQVTVEQQEQLLQHWKVLGLQQGIITINCLTLKQITAFIAVSYPSVPRIDCILSAVKDLSAVLQEPQKP